MGEGAAMHSNKGHAIPMRVPSRIAVIATAALAVMLASARADDQACLACHGGPGMDKTLGDGNKLSLHVDGAAFAKSVHAPLGCAGCHGDVDLAKHPGSGQDIKSARDFRLKSVEVCRGCHADKFDEWEKSVHAAMVRDHNAAAPVCTDCHNQHAVIKDAAAAVETIPCQNCHHDIYEAYLGSVHAKARLQPATAYAPVCSGCHAAHSVKPVVSEEGPKVACLGCHAEVLDKHRTWLPNAAQHFEVVSCPACHSPTAKRKVDLMIYDRETKARVQQEPGVPVFERRPAAADQPKNFDALALWRLIASLNPEGRPSDIFLRGRLEVQTGPDAHRLADKGKAISDCAACHQKGSAAFENVTISVAGPDGRRIREQASAGVLTSAISTGSIGGFYAIGATRVGFLDLLLVLGFLGGFGFWTGHLTIRWLYKRYGLYRG